MKKAILLVILAITTSVCSFAQEAEEPESRSNTILFQKQGNMFILRKFYEIGAIPGVEFENIAITQIQTDEKVGALRLITHDYSSSFKKSESFIGTIDYDELDTCISVLEYMDSLRINQNPEINTEYEYTSRDNVRICLFGAKKGWNLVIQTKSYTRRSAQYMDADQLPKVIEYIKKAKEQLKGILE